MKFCNADGCDNPVFGKGYCRNHQYKREDFDKRSIVQRGIDKHKANPTKQIVKELRFQSPKKIHKETFDVSVLNSGIIPIANTPESFDGKEINRPIMDEVGVWAAPPKNIGNDMDLFWKRAESVIRNKPYCWECGDHIHPNYYMAATAHIFPKSIFESVAANEWNYLVLGAHCGCHNLTHRLDTFSQMKVFPTAVNRYLKFGHLITENHKYLDLFLEYANQII